MAAKTKKTETYARASRSATRTSSARSLKERARLLVDDAGAAVDEDHAEHGRRRGQDRREGARRGDRGAHHDRRPARADAPRAQVDRRFKLREGMPIGTKVTLRGARMYEFLDRLVSIALPRIRDFRGLNPRLVRRPRQLLDRHPRADHLPRDRLRRRQQIRGLDVTITTTARRRTRPRALLRGLGLPFAADRREQLVAKKSLIAKAARPQASRCRTYTRCNRCGRPRAVYKKFGLCRICLRELAHQGVIPGMTKSRW